MAVLISSYQKLICSTNILSTNYKRRLGDTLNSLCEIDICKPCPTGYFGLMGFPKRSYSGKQLVGYSREQMFDVVSDVESYEKFVPWCKRSIVTSRREGYMEADLIIGFPPITERYTSVVSFVRPNVVKAESVTGILFKYLVTYWRFHPGLEHIQQSCVVDFSVDFEFKSVFHSQLAHTFLTKVVSKMEEAFLQEARRRYGSASMNALPLRMSEDK